MEIVRGIPSVEYGDLTSGLVKIERRRGGHDLQARLKSDMGSKLFYLAKAYEWNGAPSSSGLAGSHTTLNLSVDFGLDKNDRPDATLKISYNADPDRYAELNPIIYRQLQNIADRGPAASSMQKVKEYLIKQYDQVAITNDYWSYIIWHELDDDTDFDRDYCKMVSNMTAADVQRMAQRLLAAKRCIEVTMLSE